MNKQMFLAELERLLQGIPEEERLEFLDDMEEHFLVAQEQGKSEEDIIIGLGHPKNIARELRAQYSLDQVKTEKTTVNVFRALIATASLGFFNLVFILGPVLAAFGVLIALFAVCIAFIVAPIVVFFALMFSVTTSEMLSMLFVVFILFGLGLLFGVGLVYVSKWFIDLLIRYLQFNVKVIKGVS